MPKTTTYRYYVNYKKNLSKKRTPKRTWYSASKSFDTQQEALQWLKDNNMKLDRWTHLEECEVNKTLLADIFYTPNRRMT